MTYKGAIDEVKSLANNSLMPVIFKPSLKKIAETLEMERPTATLNENKGEWVACKRELLYFCSECRYYSQNNLFNFCPNYGADMRGE